MKSRPESENSGHAKVLKESENVILLYKLGVFAEWQ